MLHLQTSGFGWLRELLTISNSRATEPIRDNREPMTSTEVSLTKRSKRAFPDRMVTSAVTAVSRSTYLNHSKNLLHLQPTMVRQQLFQRASTLMKNHAIQPSLRNTVQRRLASGEMPKLVGTADNAFNRERMAVKQHAAASSGTSHPEFDCGKRTRRTNTYAKISGGNYLSSKEEPSPNAQPPTPPPHRL